MVRNLASETSLHYRNLRFPGSTVLTGVAVAPLAFSMRLYTLPTVTTPSFTDECVRV